MCRNELTTLIRTAGPPQFGKCSEHDEHDVRAGKQGHGSEEKMVNRNVIEELRLRPPTIFKIETVERSHTVPVDVRIS